MCRIFLFPLFEQLKHEFAEARCSFLQHFAVNIVCVKIFVGSGELIDCVVCFLPAQGVVAPLRFFPSLYWALFHFFVDRVTESIVEIELSHVFPREEDFPE